MGMAIIALLLMSNSLSIREIVDMQQGLHWNVFYQPLGFLIFLICAFAECNRAPFDLPESESELVGGYHTEYSSMKLGIISFCGIHQHVYFLCHHFLSVFWRLSFPGNR